MSLFRPNFVYSMSLFRPNFVHSKHIFRPNFVQIGRTRPVLVVGLSDCLSCWLCTQLEKHVPKLTVLVNTEAVGIILWNPDRSRIKYDYARMVSKHLIDFLVRVSVKES